MSTSIIDKNLSYAMPIEKASRIYRVINGRDLLPGDLESVTIEEVEKYVVAPTFDEFVHRNGIVLIEEVLR